MDMQIDILTLFPESVDAMLNVSILGRAQERGYIAIRTHQIRAQFAAAGHPLLGDGKYGSERQNKRYGRSYQALYSYRLEFCFTTDAGALAPLDGQQFQVEQVDFVTEYFPGFSL